MENLEQLRVGSPSAERWEEMSANISWSRPAWARELKQTNKPGRAESNEKPAPKRDGFFLFVGKMAPALHTYKIYYSRNFGGGHETQLPWLR